MNRRYLFGPVSRDYADRNLKTFRATGECLAFNAAGDLDLQIGASDTWDAVCSRLPDGWRPDFLALNLSYTSVPNSLWQAPVPLIGLAGDWSLLWHYYRRRLPSCEMVLTDLAGAEAMNRAGMAHGRAAVLFGCDALHLAAPGHEAVRDIDILFVGNVNPAVQRERLSWLGRLATLADRWNVRIATGVFGDEYRQLLARSRIVFNRSIRGECNLRTFEAAAAGALLFQESENREVPRIFADRTECVFYDESNLEALLTHYLEHEEERRTVAVAGRTRVAQFSFERFWESHLATIEGEWPALTEKAARRKVLPVREELLTRTLQALSTDNGDDPTLYSDLRSAVEAGPDAEMFNALGLIITLMNGRGAGVSSSAVEAAAAQFHLALDSDPQNVMAALNLIEALVLLGRAAEAKECAERTLAILPRASAASWTSAHFPPIFDTFRVEWERATTVEDQQRLVRWRLHALLGQLTDDVTHFHEATLARSDLPTAHAALGCALARSGRPHEAAEHLRRSVVANPFDGEAARALFEVLGAAGDKRSQRRLTRDRRRLAKAAPGVVSTEEWFTNGPPVGDELTSIIVLCCNEVEYTRQCIESVLRHTRAPYELVLVDNGSTDETPTYVAEVTQRPGPAHVAILRNETNVGFAVGCNQALAQARGEYVVFLNNDTIVTECWLDRLIQWSLFNWPRTGLVGPVSNGAPAPQHVSVTYSDTSGIDAFAQRRHRKFAGQALPFPRVTGFCMLTRREVLNQIGGFDERYQVGFFEDDDLCVRAREAGYDVLVALDVFIHHFGSRTFMKLGIDPTKQLNENFAKFREKWGESAAAGYCMPESNDSVATRQRISLCMIVKNEEGNLADCLASVAGLVDEMVIVDTGSTDGTKAIASQFGARVFEFPWVDSFAAARNESLRHATGDWIFWLDADDRLDEANQDRLRRLFTSLRDENAAYSMKCLCLAEAGAAATVVDHVRLFRHRPDVLWQFRVHEQILPALRASGSDVRWSDVTIRHVGYQDPVLRRRKLERDIALLRLEDEERPDNPFTLFNLGSVYVELGRLAEAIPLLQRSLALSAPQDSIVRKLHALLATCHRQRGEKEQALAVCGKGREFYPDDVELLFHEGVIRRDMGDRRGAESCWLRLLGPQDTNYFASVDTALTGYKVRHNLGILYEEQGRLVEAESQWRAVLTEQPAFMPAFQGLGEVYLKQRRWQDLEGVADTLDAMGAGADATAFRVRRHLEEADFDGARERLAVVSAASPDAVWPRRLLSHAYLLEGRDWPAAEKALKAILEIAPDDPEARHNLAVLEKRKAS
jgi:GT2 family glycosyltransferase/Flp pilus assembly protein TadD